MQRIKLLNSPYSIWVLSLLVGLLLSAAWNFSFFTPLVFIALSPLLILFLYDSEHRVSGLKKVLMVYLAFLMANVGSLYWLFNTQPLNVLFVIILNSFLYTLPFILLLTIDRASAIWFKSLLFISSWLALEYLILHWELSFPLLNLGNIFGKLPLLVQWYEYTGILGGSLWILLCTVLFSGMIAHRINPLVPVPVFFGKKVSQSSLLIGVFLIPSLLSVGLYFKTDSSKPVKFVKVLAIHSSLDCHSEKYNLTPDSVLNYQLHLSDQYKDSVDLVLWPETAITQALWMHELNATNSTLSTLNSNFYHAKLLTGAFLLQLVKPSDILQDQALTYSEEFKVYYKSYNAAIFLGQNSLDYKIKNKLVPFEEFAPYPSFLKPLTRVIKSLGNFNFSLKPDKNTVFKLSDKIKFGVDICYEALFGEYNTENIKRGANFMCAILNEGWYNNLTGARFFLDASVLRAIECRRDFIRSSNRGITSLVDKTGKIVSMRDQFRPSALIADVNVNTEKTFYVRQGDYIGLISGGVLIIGIVVYVLLRIVN